MYSRVHARHASADRPHAKSQRQSPRPRSRCAATTGLGCYIFAYVLPALALSRSPQARGGTATARTAHVHGPDARSRSRTLVALSHAHEGDLAPQNASITKAPKCASGSPGHPASWAGRGMASLQGGSSAAAQQDALQATVRGEDHSDHSGRNGAVATCSRRQATS